jgi:RNA polymerase sigma-70 factor (ECF subfamily)
MAPARPRTTPIGQPAASRVIELPIPVSNAALVAALKSGRVEARKVLFDRYSDEIERLLYRVLGPDPELVDLLQDVFVAALTSIHQLRDPHALAGWLRGIAVRKARKCILKRQRWRFIQLSPPSELPEAEALVPPAEVSEALRCTYVVLNRLPADERVAFALRFIEGMELSHVAEACGVSLATIKRRLSRAQASFTKLAAEQPALAEWLEPGGDAS